MVFTYQMSNSKNCRFNPSVCLANVTVNATPDVADDENVPVLKSVEKVNEDTVKFTLASPYAPFATTKPPGQLVEEAIEEAYAAFQTSSGAMPDAEVTAPAAPRSPKTRRLDAEPRPVPCRARGAIRPDRCQPANPNYLPRRSVKTAYRPARSTSLPM